MDTNSPEQLQKQAIAATEANQFWEAVELYTQILSMTAPHTEDESQKEIRLAALKERGRILGLLGEQAAALAAFEQYYLEAGNSFHAVDALVLIGNGSRNLGQHQRAIKAYQEALDFAEAINYTAGRAKALAGYGGTFLLMGHMNEARLHLERASALFAQLNDAVQQVRTLNKLGIAHALSGEMDKAIGAFEKAILLAQENGRIENHIAALNNLGECHQHLHNFQQAAKHHKQALQLAKSAQLRILESDICRNLGVDLVHLGDVENGLAYLHRALALGEETEDLELRLNTLYNLALTELGRNNITTAETYAAELQETAVSRNLQNHQARANHILGLIAKKQGNIQSAQEHWQQALFLAHETNQRMLLWQIHAELGELADNANLAAVHNRIAAEVIQQIAEPIEDEQLKEAFLQAPTIKAIIEKEII